MCTVRSKAITCLLAIIVQIASPGLVLCQEIDGSVQIEFARGDCCLSGPTQATQTTVDRSERSFQYAGFPFEEASREEASQEAASQHDGEPSIRVAAAEEGAPGPDCECEQDSPLSQVAERTRSDAADTDVNANINDSALPDVEGSEAHGRRYGVCLRPTSPIQNGVLAAQRTIVLLN